MEGYLNSISNREHRVQYSKIRISNHRLAIETGRFNKTPRNARLCLYCKKRSNSVIEDEKHVLLHCPQYDIHRNQLFTYVDESCPRFKELNDCDQFNYLLNSDGPIVKAVARFFYTANMTNNTYAALPYTEYPLRMLKFEIRAEITEYDATIWGGAFTKRCLCESVKNACGSLQMS